MFYYEDHSDGTDLSIHYLYPHKKSYFLKVSSKFKARTIKPQFWRKFHLIILKTFCHGNRHIENTHTVV